MPAEAADCADIAQQAFETLRHLGFKHTRARSLVDKALESGTPSTLEELVRAALRAT